MADDQNPVEGVDVENVNAAAEKDVKNVLAELRAEKAENREEKKDPEANGESIRADGERGADAEAKEEARIIAAANKLGQEAASKTDSKEAQRGRGQSFRGFRGRLRDKVNYRDNIKSDFTTLEETDDPDEIRKQVRDILYLSTHILHIVFPVGLEANYLR
jgi:lupus La protein